MFNGKNVLITGGTGSFGKKTVEYLLENYSLNKLIIFSRDELKQFEMQARFPVKDRGCLRYFIGDIRERDRLLEAFQGVDYIIHAAALKQVPAAEYNPFEAVKTNVIGSQNIIQAAIRRNIKKVIALSTDKAAAPSNLYGATKLCADKLFINGNMMSGEGGCRFSVVRYGNVFGSRGSVIPFFLKRKGEGTLPLTDKRMTRFSISLDEAIEFTLHKFEIMYGGELYVPKIPSYKLVDVAKAIDPGANIEYIGIRPGEKLHECMITEDDARSTLEFDTYYTVLPDLHRFKLYDTLSQAGGKLCTDGFSYTSGDNSEWLTVQEIRDLVNRYCKEHSLQTI